MAAVVPGDDLTGPSGQVVSTAAALAARDVGLRLVLLRRPSAPPGRLPGILDRMGIPYASVEDRGVFDPALPGRVRDVLANWGPTIVESHGYKASAVCLLLHRRRAWHWIGYFHGLTHESRKARFYHWLDQRMLRFADCTVVISEQQRQLLRGARNTRIVHSAPTALGFVAPDESNAEFDATLASLPRPRIGVIGRLSREKGVDVFLHAAAGLAERGTRFTALIAGDGPERPTLERLASSLELDDRVHFLGRVNDIAGIYHELDLIVIPSRSEGLPSVLLEALDADVPVVATRVGAIPEVLVTPGAGTLVPPESPVALTEAIIASLTTLGDAALRIARGEAARAFSQERRAAALSAIYFELVGKP